MNSQIKPKASINIFVQTFQKDFFFFLRKEKKDSCVEVIVLHSTVIEITM